jgi:hypothetical protein
MVYVFPGRKPIHANITLFQLQEALKLSYKNSRELNHLIDNELPGRPHFIREEINVAGQVFELYRRDIIECIRELFGDPEFAPHLILVPEHHYTSQDKTDRIYHEMHTGQWWWDMQVRFNGAWRIV